MMKERATPTEVVRLSFTTICKIPYRVTVGWIYWLLDIVRFYTMLIILYGVNILFHDGVHISLMATPKRLEQSVSKTLRVLKDRGSHNVPDLRKIACILSRYTPGAVC
jgi:hypothetical protein